MPMSWDQWTAITAKLNVSFPDQPINPATAREWFDDLERYDPGEVWLAIRTVRRIEKFRPQLAMILAGIELHRRDLAAARHAQLADTPGSRRGIPIPPETHEALQIIDEAVKPDSGLDRDQAVAMIDALADQLEQRARDQTETAADATRTCAACATSPISGHVQATLPGGHPDNLYDHHIDVYLPCQHCRPGRHRASTTGQLHLRADDQGYPLADSRTQHPFLASKSRYFSR